ncbi:tetratricopeptide repeat protein [Candidatus Omnitrophota bacterium]
MTHGRKILVQSFVLFVLLSFLSIYSFAQFQGEGYTPITEDGKEKVLDLNEKGVEFFNQEKYEEALRCFKAAYKIAPNDTAIAENLNIIYVHIAVQRLNEKQFQEAIHYFTLALDMSGDPEIKKNIGYTYFTLAQSIYEEEADVDKTLANIEKGLEYVSDNEEIKAFAATMLYNSAINLYGQHEYKKAADFLNRSLEYNDERSYTYEMLGEIAYYQQNLDKAKEYWNKAVELEDSERLTKKIQKLENEMHVDNDLEDYPSQYFVIKYEKGDKFYSGYKIRQILRTAYRKVGNDFNYYPKRKIVVLLYGAEDLEKVLSKNHWAGAIYDGKIRLPQESANVSDTHLRSLIWHEYTHAIVHDLSGGKVPAWLNEGLAQYEENKIRKIDCSLIAELLMHKHEFDYANEFNKDLKQLEYNEARLFYLNAFTLTKHLIERYRMYKIKEVLAHIKNGDSVDTALEKSIFLDVDKINKKWNAYLLKNYK